MEQEAAHVTIFNYIYTSEHKSWKDFVEQEGFEETKWIVLGYVFLIYIKKWFDVHTNARNSQLIAAIIQESILMHYMDKSLQVRRPDTM